MAKPPVESTVEYTYKDKAIHDVLDIVENVPWYDSLYLGTQFRWSVRNGVWSFASGEIARRTWGEVNA